VIDSQAIYLLGIVKMPSDFVIDENTPCRGGSSVAVLIVGYQDHYFIVKGSWGTNLGDNGYFRIKMS